jgi:hypothetical protein
MRDMQLSTFIKRKDEDDVAGLNHFATFSSDNTATVENEEYTKLDGDVSLRRCTVDAKESPVELKIQMDFEFHPVC